MKYDDVRWNRKRNADQPMYTDLAFQFAISKRSIYLECRRLDTRHVTCLVIDLSYFVTALLSPHDVHAVGAFRPSPGFQFHPHLG